MKHTSALKIDKCDVNRNGQKVKPSQNVVDDLYPKSDYEELDTYFGSTLDDWQIEHARSIRAEVLAYAGDGIWIALKRITGR